MRRSLTALALVPLPALAQDDPFAPAFPEQMDAPALEATAVSVETLAGGLEHPWGIAALPDGTFLVTERPGRMRLMAADGALSDPIGGLPEVDARRQGGLLDVAVAEDFADTRTVFWTYSVPLDGGMTAPAAARGVLSEDGTEMTEVEVIFQGDPPSDSPMHYGSRILPDGEYVWITTGEHSAAATRDRAQDLMTTWGKVLRLTADGAQPEGNPFSEDEAATGVWSYGHRNIQGIAQDADGRLWISEHGPRGGDEINLIEAGANYGWPEVSYGPNYDGSPVGRGVSSAPEFTEPVYVWRSATAPAGIAFYDGDLFEDWQGDLLVSSLNPGALIRLSIEGERVTGEERLLTDVGRVRDVLVDADGALLVLTDEPDGRVLRVVPEGFPDA
ncbi:PQQ-dependent sugar dehydrogenase [Rubellimicrobium sp. CFH 75288]|uniref:PQQ-dependent sugar dehydrogenase n=1 Tax=Rubellimicrobium sp. CFH 75288 TaxID=2697034 RepID=UPI00141223B0|nr:PQQ-dependent sugar dehydrogenase [Rubellimicrobium sp. CFH 75288]NAZ37404.1 PQQ-dependent sugar dehydrogenase [Rubellimicrobium sp. CFH 75288]